MYLTIHIIESNPGFASVTDISLLAQKLILNGTVINIGHLDEIHYGPIVPFNEEAIADNVICNNQPLKKHHNQSTLIQNALLAR